MALPILPMLCLCLFVCQIYSENSVLVRRKRYVVFPEGATVSVAMCFTLSRVSTAPTAVSESVNWVIAYDLPNDTSTSQALSQSKHVLQRRSRRDLYGKIELVMDSLNNGLALLWCNTGSIYFNRSGVRDCSTLYMMSAIGELDSDRMGFDGRSCIFRALCEAEQRIFPNDGDIIEELLRVVFRFPLQRVYNSEPEIHRWYHWARRMGREENDCNSLFPACHISLLEIILNLQHLT